MIQDQAYDLLTMKKNYTIWRQEEDKLLKDYVNQHGDVTWTDVPKHTGLSRTAKSCRFRWVNYLRPDLKKGPFTEKEEQTPSCFGDKWAQMSIEVCNSLSLIFSHSTFSSSFTV